MIQRDRKRRYRSDWKALSASSPRWAPAFCFFLVFVIFFVGIRYRWSQALHFDLFLLLFLTIFWMQSRSVFIKEKLKSTGIFVVSLFLALLLTGWIVLYEISILPSQLNVQFSKIFTTTYSFPGEQNRQDKIVKFIHENINTYPSSPVTPAPGESIVSRNLQISQLPDVVGNIAVIQVLAIPKPRHVYLLIHPHNTQFWYVQTPLEYRSAPGDPNGYWEGTIYFGQLDGDCGMKYDVIALATKESPVLDLFRGRSLQEGKILDYLPVLNQSDIILVRKMCS